MAFQQYSLHACKAKSLHRICMTQSSGDRKESPQEVTLRPGPYPAQQLSSLESTFRRRLLTGVGSSSLVAVGANFTGITSFLLGFSPETGRNLKLDVLYPIDGYSRYVQTNEGFGNGGTGFCQTWRHGYRGTRMWCTWHPHWIERPTTLHLRASWYIHHGRPQQRYNGTLFPEFIYPAGWVGDQTLLYRAVGKLERSLDPPLQNNNVASNRRRDVNEPVVAFGPPGSTGELNVSVIVSPVPLDFSIEAFGGAKEVGETVIGAITGLARQSSDVKGMLVQSSLREDSMGDVKYYEVEYRVESPTLRRHNMAVCCARGGRLFTLNAQAPESAWPQVKLDFYRIADSFKLTS